MKTDVRLPHYLFWGGAALFILLWLMHGPGIVRAAGPKQQPVRLEPDKAITEKLGAGENRVFHVSARSGQHLRIAVMQDGIKVTLSISGPDGRQMAEAVSLYGRQGPVAASIIAEASGDHTAEVRSTEKGAPEGKFEIRIEALREPSAADKSLVTAQKIAEEGRRLQSRPDSASWKKAIERYKEALPHWQAAADRLAEANTLQSIGLTYRALGDMPQAIKYYESALAIQQTGGDRRGEAFTLAYLGLAIALEGNLRKALDCYEQSLRIWQALDYKLGLADAHNRIGGIYDLRGELQEALRYYEIALNLRRDLANRGGMAAVLNNIATIYDKLGETQKTIETYNRAAEILAEVSDYKTLASVFHNLGYTYASLGDSQTALRYYEQAREVRKKANDPLNDATTIASIGRLSASEGDFRKALEYYNQALVIQKEANSSWQAYTLINIGQAYVSLGEIEKAITYYEQALKLLREAGDRQGEAFSLDRLGQALTQAGQSQRALDALQSALPLWQAVGDRNGEATTLYGIARVESGRGRLAEARKRIEEAIAIAESMRTKVSGQDLRAFYLASVRDYYDLGVDLLMELHQTKPSEGYDVAALHLSDRARARSLLESLIEAHADIRRGADSTLLERERQLEHQLDATVQRQVSLANEKYTEAQKAALDKEVATILTEYRQVQAQIRVTNPRYAELSQPQILNLQETQERLLDQDTLLLEYALGNERSYLWVITKSSISSFVLPPRRQIETAVRNFYELLTARGRVIKGEREAATEARTEKADRDFPEASAHLSQMLLAPAAPLLAGKRLLIVPDGALHYIPFAALPAPDASYGAVAAGQILSSPQNRRAPANISSQATSKYRPLIVDHEIVYIPSVSVLSALRHQLQGRQPASHAVAVLADPVFASDDPRLRRGAKIEARAGEAPSDRRSLTRAVVEAGAAEDIFAIPRLPFSRREADAIVAAATDKEAMKALDFDASRDVALSSQLGQYRILHFATHAFLNNKHPEFSGIVLSLVDKQGKPVNGFLQLRDVYNLKLPAELVVLSACQTGLGKEIRGEGLIGLTRGFMYAGAARVMASLWKVDDAATAALMSRFYKRVLGEGLRPAEALRAAQVEMWRQKAWNSPYYWAAFTLQGEWR
jgi:CHAT domain-containing protein/Tfp pilus assembly protein PilF